MSTLTTPLKGLLIIDPSDRDTRGVRAEVLSAGSDGHGTGFPPHHPFGANRRPSGAYRLAVAFSSRRDDSTRRGCPLPSRLGSRIGGKPRREGEHVLPRR